MRSLLIALCLLFGAGAVVDAPPASAYLTQCTTYMNPVNQGYGMSRCDSHANNGGNNLQRVVVYCRGWAGGSNYYSNGPWVLEDYTSVAYCGAGWVPQSVTYQLL